MVLDQSTPTGMRVEHKLHTKKVAGIKLVSANRSAVYDCSSVLQLKCISSQKAWDCIWVVPKTSTGACVYIRKQKIRSDITVLNQHVYSCLSVIIA